MMFQFIIDIIVMQPFYSSYTFFGHSKYWINLNHTFILITKYFTSYAMQRVLRCPIEIRLVLFLHLLLDFVLLLHRHHHRWGHGVNGGMMISSILESDEIHSPVLVPTTYCNRSDTIEIRWWKSFQPPISNHILRQVCPSIYCSDLPVICNDSEWLVWMHAGKWA